MIGGEGGNIGVFIGEDGTFLIDDQFAPLTEKIVEAIKSVGGDHPKFLINTHYHGDHTGGNE
jgi:glyoxylase-like metal-dependent hydrolase (beta-lactamase superfamily II)